MLYCSEKNQTNTSGEQININGKIIKSEETVKLLGVTLDYRLDFDPHISNLCKKAATQLNVLKRLKMFIGFQEKKILVQSFVYSNISIIAPWFGISHLLNHCRR